MAGVSHMALLASYGTRPVDFIDSTTSTLDATAVPTGAGSGDLVVACGWARRASSDPTAAALANGWKEAVFIPRANPSSNNYALRIIYKRLDGAGDAGQQLFSSESDVVTACLAFSGGGTEANHRDAKGSVVHDGGEDLAAQTTGASAGKAPLVVIALEAVAQLALFAATLSPAADASAVADNAGATGGELHLRASYKVYNAAPADHTVNAPGGGTAIRGQGICYIEA